MMTCIHPCEHLWCNVLHIYRRNKYFEKKNDVKKLNEAPKSFEII